MSPRRWIFDTPDRFVADAVGQPGQRTFYLQAAQGRSSVTVALEKSQLAVLADRLGELLGEVERRGAVLAPGTVDAIDTTLLRQPVEEAFRVGTMTLAWDGMHDAVVFEARSTGETELADALESASETAESTLAEPDESDERDLLQVRITAPAARGFVAHAMSVVAAGRPPCPLCGQPLNPEGHLCPRRNGYMH